LHHLSSVRIKHNHTLVVAVSWPWARLHTPNQTRKRLQPGSNHTKTSNKATGRSGPSSGWPEPGSLARPSRAGISNTPLDAAPALNPEAPAAHRGGPAAPRDACRGHEGRTGAGRQPRCFGQAQRRGRPWAPPLPARGGGRRPPPFRSGHDHVSVKEARRPSLSRPARWANTVTRGDTVGGGRTSRVRASGYILNAVGSVRRAYD
jgi:hypothetical protein